MRRNQCCKVSLSLVVPYEEVLPKRAYSTSAGIGHYSFMWIENAGARKISSLEGVPRDVCVSVLSSHVALNSFARCKSQGKVGRKGSKSKAVYGSDQQSVRCMHKERCLRKRLRTQRTEYRKSYPISRNSIDKTSDLMP